MKLATVSLFLWLIAASMVAETGEPGPMSEQEILEQVTALRVRALDAMRDGGYVDAIDLATRATTLGASKLGLLHESNTESYLLVSELAGRLGQPATSVVYAENAFSSAEATLEPDDPKMGVVLRGMGSAYARSGDYESAEEFLLAAFALHEENPGPDSLEVAADGVALAKLYLRGDAPLALTQVPALLKRALDIRQAQLGESSPGLAEVWQLYAEAITASFTEAAEAEDVAPEQALEAGETALAAAEGILDRAYQRPNPAFVPVFRTRGDLHMKAGRLEDAFDAYALAVESGGDHPAAGDALRLAVLAATRGDVQLTLAACGAASSVSASEFREFAQWAGVGDKLKYRGRSSPAQQVCLSLIYSLNMPADEKAREMLKILLTWRATIVRSERARYRGWRNDDEPEFAEDVAEIQRHHRLLAEALVRAIQAGEPDLDDLRQTVEELHRLEEIVALARFGVAVSEASELPKLADLVARLSPHSALLFFLKVDHFDFAMHTPSGTGEYLALIVQPDATVVLRGVGEAAVFESQVQRALRQFRVVDRLDIPGQLELVSEMYQLIWQPVADVLEPYTTVMVLAEGPIGLVPLSALRDEGGRYLAESTRLIHITSPSDLFDDEEAREPPEKQLLLVAVRDFGESDASGPGDSLRFDRLEGAEQEKAGIESIFEVEALTHAQATEAALRQAPSAHIVHFATHGYFLDDAALQPATTLGDMLTDEGYRPIEQEVTLIRSGLALAGANVGHDAAGGDGVLTALEITGMDFSRTELVTLSACDTGLGIVHQDEGVFGLRLAFELAGARNLIMSLWTVQSRELNSQMKLLYQQIEAGASPASALHETQKARIKWFRKYLGEAPPALWASLTVQTRGGVPTLP